MGAGSRRLRDLLLRPVVAAASWAAGLLPLGAVRRAGAVAGGIGWRTSTRSRPRVLAHLEIAFPELTESERDELGRHCFRQQMTNALELLHLAARGARAAAAAIEVEGWEHVDAARRRGRPLLVISGHCGSWELLGAVFAGAGAELAAVVRGLQDPGLGRVVERLRRRFGTRTITRGGPGAARELLGALRGGTALLMLIDQDIEGDGVWVPFFGRPAHTPAGAARLAIKRRATVLAAFVERRDDGSLGARITPPLDLPADVTAATAAMTAAIEAQIRRRPAQWVWWHKRWRRRPPA